ncbi:MAG TPA: ATP-binding protein [Bacillus bacterium]|nr:ATP-binding protein [Bacillus sp. (in: firmicutes)]
MKTINLLSLLSAKDDLNAMNFAKYIEQFGINPKIRAGEIEDIEALVDEFMKRGNQFDILNHYYVGFTIKQIGKEFDLLRIGENSIINIELKLISTEEKIIKQLVQNQHYLKFLDVDVYSFTYISATKKLYALVGPQEIKEVEFEVLIEKLKEQIIKEIDDLDNLFDPTNYIVSPFNSTDAFIEDKYFLSAQQSTFKREIIQLTPMEQSIFIAIKGGSGSGKTLLTYDIAKEYMRQSKKVLIFNCGKLNNGHVTLKTHYHWSIEAISNFSEYDDHSEMDIEQYELIIFDEAQRIYKNKFLKLTNLLQQLKIKCIFSYDPNQCLTALEIENNIPKLIEETLNPYQYELTTIIRHNKEIHAFINKLFDLSKHAKIENYSDISIQYFSLKGATTSYLQSLQKEGWKVIDYTETRYIEHPDNDHIITTGVNSHDGIGQELDCVVAVIDESFYYKPNHKLSTKDLGKQMYYQPTRMLYQNISRTKKKLQIVIYNNPDVLDEILKIL